MPNPSFFSTCYVCSKSLSINQKWICSEKCRDRAYGGSTFRNIKKQSLKVIYQAVKLNLIKRKWSINKRSIPDNMLVFNF